MILPAHRATRPSHERLVIDCAAASRFDAVRQWSASRLHHARHIGPIPLAGTPDWQALDDTDPRKTAAIFQSALAWLRECMPEVIVDRLRADLDTIDRCHADRMKATADDICGAADWTRVAAGPTLRELTQRRNTYPCPDCNAPLRFIDTRCTACGWAEPTPQQQREAARLSWARFDHVGSSCTHPAQHRRRAA